MADPIVDPTANPPADPPVVDPPVDPPPAEDWRSGFQDDLKAEKSLDSFTKEDGSLNVEAMAKTTVEAQKMIGGSVRIPKDDATPEEWAEFHGKMGRPDDVAGYEFVKPDLPEGIEWNEDMLKWFGDAAHKRGASKAMAQGLMNDWNDYQFSQAHEAQKAMKRENDALHETWGDKYDGYIELGVRGIEHLLSSAEDVKEFKDIMNTTGVGDKTVILKAFCTMGKILKEDGYIIGDGQGGILGADSAKAKIKEIYADTKHPWHTGDKAAMEEMTGLYKIAHPPKERSL